MSNRTALCSVTFILLLPLLSCEGPINTPSSSGTPEVTMDPAQDVVPGAIQGAMEQGGGGGSGMGGSGGGGMMGGGGSGGSGGMMGGGGSGGGMGGSGGSGGGMGGSGGSGGGMGGSGSGGSGGSTPPPSGTSPTGLKVGDACKAGDTCPAGGSGTPVCRTAWTGGYCLVEACKDHGHDCPGDPGLGGTVGDSKCVLAPTATCLKLCTTATDCRAGYTCTEKADAAGHGPAKVCVP